MSDSIKWPQKPCRKLSLTALMGPANIGLMFDLLETETPSETTLAILKRLYPGSDPAKAPWGDLRADLLAVGVPVETVESETGSVLLRMLDNERGVDETPPDRMQGLTDDEKLAAFWKDDEQRGWLSAKKLEPVLGCSATKIKGLPTYRAMLTWRDREKDERIKLRSQ